MEGGRRGGDKGRKGNSLIEGRDGEKRRRMEGGEKRRVGKEVRLRWS